MAAHRSLIDWSHWQVDERAGTFPDLGVATTLGVDGHLFRAGRGHDIDPAFTRFVAEAKRVGRPWGAYWWPEPCLSTPVEQAKLTWSTVSAAGRPDLPLDIDVEGHRGEQPGAVAPYRPLSPVEQATWLRAYLDELRRLSGRDRLIIYTADWYWNPKIAPAGLSFADCDLRVAHYLPGTPTSAGAQWAAWLGTKQPDIPTGWTTWDAWQFSAEKNKAGPTYGAASADLDLNVVRADVWPRWLGTVTAAEVLATPNLVEVDMAKLPVVRAGMTGPPVCVVQALLNVHLAGAGRPPIEENGIWPTGTTSPTAVAMAWFQGAKGLAADRIVGQRTWSALLGIV